MYKTNELAVNVSTRYMYMVDMRGHLLYHDPGFQMTAFIRSDVGFALALNVCKTATGDAGILPRMSNSSQRLRLVA